MTLYLTESQINDIIVREGLKSLLEESVALNEVYSDRIKESIRNAIIAGVASTAIISAIYAAGNLNVNQKQQLADYAEYVESEINGVSQEDYDIAQKELHQLKVQELERCMHDKYLLLKGHKAYNPNDIVLSAEEMVTACEEHNYDLVLAAAQAWNESAWGTTPRAMKTNSVFSVGAYDNGKDAVKYDTINASIRPYIKLMQNDYGLTPDTLDDIFNGKRSLVNNLGMRYASSETYEKNLKSTYNSIKKNYPILSWDVETYLENNNNQQT